MIDKNSVQPQKLNFKGFLISLMFFVVKTKQNDFVSSTPHSFYRNYRFYILELGCIDEKCNKTKLLFG